MYQPFNNLVHADYFRAAFLEFKFPAIEPTEFPNFNLNVSLPIEVFDHEKRGQGLTISSQMVIVPDYQPFDDCYKENCLGTLV